MAAFDAVTELPPPSRTWEGDEDLEGPRQAADEPGPAFQWFDAAGSALGAHLDALAEVATLTLNTRLPEDAGADDTPSREYRCTVLAPGGPRRASPLLLAAACHPPPPADRCFRVLILGSMPSSNYRGLSHGDEPFLFSLHTDAERAARCFGNLGVPLLPPGSLVEGLSASVLSHCQVRGIPTVAVVHVLHGALSVRDLAQLAGVLSHLPEVDCMVAEEANGHRPSRAPAGSHLDLPLRKAQDALIKRKRTLAVSDLYI
eukprot:SM000046S16412  [mRNA]  locus=s46:559069:561684:+ [translate_table: standard]